MLKSITYIDTDDRVKCQFCGKPIKAEIRVYDTYDDGMYVSESVFAKEDLRGIEWEYVMSDYACIDCYNNRHKVLRDYMRNDVIKDLEKRLPQWLDDIRKRYEEELMHVNERIRAKQQLLETLDRFDDFKNLPKDVQNQLLQSTDGYLKDELVKLFQASSQRECTIESEDEGK